MACHAVLAGRVHAGLATVVVGLLVLLPASSSSTTEICKDVRLIPLHYVCGALINVLSESIARATVTILRDGTGLAAFKTGDVLV